MTTSDALPTHLEPPATAALDWLNRTQGAHFELTGLAGPAIDVAALKAQFELGLVVCDGEICAREQVRVTPIEDGWSFAMADEPEAEIPPLLDPPPGLRREWFERMLEQHDFLLLLFYRGRW